jgi:hypothetical protein
MIFLSAFGSGFVGDSLEFYTGMDDMDATFKDMASLRYGSCVDFLKKGEYWEAFKVIMAIFGELFVKVIPSFDRYDTVTAVATGMNIQPWTVLECVLRVGIIAPVALGLLAWFCFEQRDLVRSNTWPTSRQSASHTITPCRRPSLHHAPLPRLGRPSVTTAPRLRRPSRLAAATGSSRLPAPESSSAA